MGERLKAPAIVIAIVVIIISATGVFTWARQRNVAIIVGKTPMVTLEPTPTPTPVPTPEPGADPVPVAKVAPRVAVRQVAIPAPRPAPTVKPKPTVPFHGAVNVPKDLKFFLAIGSDARSGQDMLRARADSIHVLAVDPLARTGTILGIPRDTWVDIPGIGNRKINAALPIGGPDLLVETVRKVTGLPIEYWAVVGFRGFESIANDLGGVDVYVPYRMDDHYSGADFNPGWKHMNGREVLAFSRARHGVPKGDFGRSANHGRVMIDTLRKMRAEVTNVDGIRKWVGILFKHARLDMSMGEAIEFGKLARQLSPNILKNVVMPGRTGTASGQSVVFTEPGSFALFKDVGADAEADGNNARSPSKATPPPTPKPTPTPGLLDPILNP